MGYKTYTREEYLKWCKDNGVKTILSESERNQFTESGYPTKAPFSGCVSKNIVYDDIDADEYYKAHW